MLSGCTGHPGTHTIGMSAARLPLPSQVIGQAHASGGVSFHGMNPAVGRAGSRRHNRPGLGSQTVDPVAGQDGLARLLVRAPRCPVAFLLIVFVGNRSFDDQDEGPELAFRSQVKRLQKLVAVLDGKEGIMEVDLGNPWQRAHHNVFDAGLRGGGHGDGVAVASKSGRHPQNIEFGDRTVGSAFDRWVHHRELPPRMHPRGFVI